MEQLGVIGFPLRHSLSPVFQQAALDRCGIRATYRAWETPPEALADAVRRLREPDYLGMNVTVPHKQAVMAYLDRVDPLAARIGAVNTVVREGNDLVGYNTDADGFLESLRRDGRFDPRERRALILGAGGAARAVAFALLKAGVRHLAITNRNPARAHELCQALATEASSVMRHPSCVMGATDRVGVVPWDAAAIAAELGAMDLLVNCTTVGLRHTATEGVSPLPSLPPAPHLLVCDLIYLPEETPLLAQARMAGAGTLGGLPMLIYQGAAAFTLWTGWPAPVEAMFSAARAALAEREKP
ncbi:MAG: shikimate dehydrogenase [Chloroflexi bacterium]|nr:shikimate dehydrogenase [Chloroflexota bacterium]